MRNFVFLTALILGALLVVGSSGNFRAYEATRYSVFSVTSGETSYVAYKCLENPVEVEAGEGVEFTAVEIQNLMRIPIEVHVSADFSGLPPGVVGDIGGDTRLLEPFDSTYFEARVESSQYSEDGLYEVPITVYAEWDGGSAILEACSLFVKVSEREYVLTKTLIGGNKTFPANTPQEWVMEVSFKNNGNSGSFLIADFVDPAYFRIDDVEISEGQIHEWTMYEITGFVLWEVNVEHGERVTMRLYVSNRVICTPCSGQIYSTNEPGMYILNCGACVVENREGGHCCGDHDWEHWRGCCGDGCHHCECLAISGNVTVEAYVEG